MEPVNRAVFSAIKDDRRDKITFILFALREWYATRKPGEGFTLRKQSLQAILYNAYMQVPLYLRLRVATLVKPDVMVYPELEPLIEVAHQAGFLSNSTTLIILSPESMRALDHELTAGVLRIDRETSIEYGKAFEAALRPMHK